MSAHSQGPGLLTVVHPDGAAEPGVGGAWQLWLDGLGFGGQDVGHALGARRRGSRGAPRVSVGLGAQRNGSRRAGSRQHPSAHP